MTDQELIDRIMKRLNQCLLELSLVSHAPTTSNSDEGGRTPSKSKPPTGGVDWMDDHSPEFPHKSHFAFIAKSLKAYERGDVKALYAILVEVKNTIHNWKHSQKPQKDWKQVVRESSKPIRDLAAEYGLSTTQIMRIRKGKDS